MSMPPVRAGDVIIAPQRFANAYCHGLFAAVEMRQSRHERARIELIHLLFKSADSNHLTIRPQPRLFLAAHFAATLRFRYGGRHFATPSLPGVLTPDTAATTSNMHAKSSFAQPMPRAAVKNSLLT